MARAKSRPRALAPRQTHRALATDGRVHGVPEFAPTDERLAHGRVTVEPILAHPIEGGRDLCGDRKDKGPRAVVMGYVRRAEDAELTDRLARFRDMPPEHVAAAQRYERTWTLAHLEPRLTTHYSPTRAGRRDWSAHWPDQGLPLTVIDARTAHHEAQKALLSVGSGEVRRVVDAVVLAGEAASKTGATRYPSSKPQALAHVRAMLDVGLGLLAAHYARARGREG